MSKIQAKTAEKVKLKESPTNPFNMAKKGKVQMLSEKVPLSTTPVGWPVNTQANKGRLQMMGESVKLNRKPVCPREEAGAVPAEMFMGVKKGRK